MEFVAEAEQAPVGFVAALAYETILHICELSVAHPWQGKGIGAALLEVLVQHAQKNDFSALTLITFADVAFNAPFYKRHGFQMLQNPSEFIVELLQKEKAQGLPIHRRIAMIREV